MIYQIIMSFIIGIPMGIVFRQGVLYARMAEVSLRARMDAIGWVILQEVLLGAALIFVFRDFSPWGALAFFLLYPVTVYKHRYVSDAIFAEARAAADLEYKDRFQ